MRQFQDVRDLTLNICKPLTHEDHVVQPIYFVSPPKWHLGHTTWFYETFCLKPFFSIAPFDSRFNFVFNSYYESQGSRLPQALRGQLSRPGLAEIIDYRKNIDSKMHEVQSLVEKLAPDMQKKWFSALALGINHEQQHQELLLMDIKAILFSQPEKPAYLKNSNSALNQTPSKKWRTFSAGVYEIGAGQEGFVFDTETPKHKVYCHDFEVREALVTNEEFLEFIEAGGYQKPELWLSDGWRWVKENKISAPLYWMQYDNNWNEYTLEGLDKLVLQQPVAHISFYEAEAFARWKNCRLPTEAEWEVAFKEDKASTRWQWTQSAYHPYPGFQPFAEDFAEYNAKFMSGQMVLRGGCEVTPEGHYRSTYRNFFQPEMRWQYSGLRLAK